MLHSKWKKLKCRRGWCCGISTGLFVLIVNVKSIKIFVMIVRQ